MSAGIINTLVHLNLAGSAAILAVLTLRDTVQHRFGARAAYALWAMVPLAALAVLLPQPAVTLVPIVLQASAAADARSAAAAGDATATPWLILAWLVGATGAGAVLLHLQARFVRSLGRLKRINDHMVRAEHSELGPAVFGVLRPRIVVPADFETRFDAEERRVMLAHEQVHLSRGDSRINALAALIQCACWFNPLVHLATRRLRIDQELACDAAVLARHPAERVLYARLLLKTQLASQALPLGCHWPTGDDHPLKQRIAMLMSPEPRPAIRRTGLAVVALLGVTSAGLAWAAQPVRPPHLIERPDWVERPTMEDAKAAYPAGAMRQRLEGRAILSCRVAVTGRLEGCRIIDEAPTDQAFGQAALSLTPRFRMSPLTVDGKPVAGGTVRIPISFRLPAALRGG